MGIEFNFLSSDRIKEIKETHVKATLDNLAQKIKEVDFVPPNKPVPEKPEYKVRFEKTQLADMASKLYKDRLQPEPPQEETPQPNTIAIRANTRALARALVGLRNGGDEGRISPVNPDTGNGNISNSRVPASTYHALTTCMTLEEYEEYIAKKFIAEDSEEETEQETEIVPELLTEAGAVEELEEKLLEMKDLSWQSIDKVMRGLADEYEMSPRELHKEFKSKHGMIPDDWAKKNQVVENVGWYPLDEMVRVNQIGQVYEVSFLYRGGRQRLKFFWPEVGYPSHDEMEKACQKFWPGARLLAYYPSHDPGDNQHNFMVMVPAMSENYNVIDDDAWDFMSLEDTEIYDEIAAEEGEPITPVYLTEGAYEMDIADHDTGEVRTVYFGEGKKGLWDNIHAKRKRGEAPAKKGDKDYPKTLNVEGYDEPELEENTLMERGMTEKGMDTALRGHKYTKQQLMDMSKKSTQQGRHAEAQSMYKAARAMKEDTIIAEDDMKGMSVKSGDKRSAESGAGMTAQGVAKYRRRNPGSKLKTAVTTPPSKLKPGSKAAGRRKSFCARSRGWTGERGKAARRRWNC